MEYNTIFTHRAKSYIYAIQTYPHVLEKEFETAVSMCRLKDGDVFVNIPGACENLREYIPNGIKYLPFETNEVLAKMMDVSASTFSLIPCENNSVDKVLSLASLHHLTNDERRVFYKEVARILRPSGMFVIGDVYVNSKQDAWLNKFVNMYNPLGHCGMFWNVVNRSDIQVLEEAGFDVDMEIKSYYWNFPTKESMVDFSKYLFGLDKATDEEIMEGLRVYLDADFKTYRFEWELVYFTARVSQVSFLDL